MKILFLEDDPVISDIVKDFLLDSISNCEVKHCFDSATALQKAEEESFDLYLFDINVPGMSGIQLLKNLREFSDATPTIFITAHQELRYLQDAFDVGANDFLRKPFELEELHARIDNIKRQFSIDEEIKIEEDIIFNPLLCQLIMNKKLISLSAKESSVLLYLIRNKNRVIATDEILQNLWEYDEMPTNDTIRTYIKNLRHLLGKEHIINVRAKGYRFE